MIEINSTNCSIWIGDNSLKKLSKLNYSKVAILVDENTKKNCLNKIPKIKNSVIIEIPSGEENKQISTCNLIWKRLKINQFDRDSVVINLGGGVLGDIGGFCASTYKRGIDFIQVPTTLLSMVDSSIGGKLGIDFDGLKNHIGLFNNPKLVLISPSFLKTLPKNQLLSGFAEVLKYALIYDLNFWNKIHSTQIEDLNFEEIILTSIRIKNDIVSSDPFDKGIRKKLNFGHTFAHAIESYYINIGNPILHGEAVFMGIILETELSPLTKRDKNEIKSYILSNFSLPKTPKISEIKPYMINDKKNICGKINFSLLEDIGSCSINNLFELNEL